MPKSFPKSERLRRPDEFQNIIRNSEQVRENGVALYFSKKDKAKSRLGILVSKRVMKNATDRNRAKRIVREFFRTRKDRFLDSFDIGVRFLENRNLLENNNLQLILERLFSRSGILK